MSDQPFEAQSEEWQPVRIAPFNTHTKETHWLRAVGKIVRVRQALCPFGRINDAEVGCDSKLFYDVHPDDEEKFNWDVPAKLTLCEHQILAD